MTAAPSSPTSVIRARGLAKSYGGRSVVHGLDLDVPAVGCFGLLGPNGAGKTTTLRMILGQSPPSAGTLEVFGLPMPAASREIRARVGVVPQTDNLDPDFTVLENLRVYAGYFRLGGPALRGRMESLLDLVDLQDRADTPINDLSGGMRRRLSIARALINSPEMLVLDEPTTGLDPQVRHMIWARLRELKRHGTTLLLTTHYMEEAERLCDELVIMDHGAIVIQGSPQALIRRHVEPEVIEVHADPDEVRHILGRHAAPRIEAVGESVYCYTRDARRLTSALEQHGDISYLHRPANLEDVFLKLTGRELRE